MAGMPRRSATKTKSQAAAHTDIKPWDSFALTVFRSGRSAAHPADVSTAQRGSAPGFRGEGAQLAPGCLYGCHPPPLIALAGGADTDEGLPSRADYAKGVVAPLLHPLHLHHHAPQLHVPPRVLPWDTLYMCSQAGGCTVRCVQQLSGPGERPQQSPMSTHACLPERGNLARARVPAALQNPDCHPSSHYCVVLSHLCSHPSSHYCVALSHLRSHPSSHYCVALSHLRGHATACTPAHGRQVRLGASPTALCIQAGLLAWAAWATRCFGSPLQRLQQSAIRPGLFTLRKVAAKICLSCLLVHSLPQYKRRRIAAGQCRFHLYDLAHRIVTIWHTGKLRPGIQESKEVVHAPASDSVR